MKRPFTTLIAMLAAFAGTLLVSPAALADDVSAAANAFARAQKAELAGDYEGAAELYELADSMAQAPEALRGALKARKAAGQLSSAAIHAEALLERYPDDKRSTDIAHATLEEAKQKLVRYEVRCSPKPCNVVVDGAAASLEDEQQHVLYLEPGEHQVRASFGNQQTEPKTTEAVIGSEQSLSFDAPPPEPKAPAGAAAGTTSTDFGSGVAADTGARSRGGLSPWVFVASSVVTLGVTGVAVWSGLDVLDSHEQYDGKETRRAYEDGKDKEKRTNFLIGGAAVAGTVTIVIAAFTDWKGKSRPAAGARLRPEAMVFDRGGGVGFRGKF
jgi:hypothetical protein